MRQSARLVGASILLAGTVATAHAGAINVIDDKQKDVSLDVALLVQPQVQVAKDASPDGTTDTEFFLRRTRVMVFGKVSKEISFFFDTDQPNWGKGGAWDAQFYVQDAVLSWSPTRAFTLDAGMLLVPFSHQSIESAASLHGLDYHTAFLRYPANAGKVLRDSGLVARGLLFGDFVYYRVGVFEGARGPALPANVTPPPAALNEKGLPRFAGEVRLNLMGVEDRLFLGGIYFAEHPMLSVGVGADWQRHAIRLADESVADHAALSADVFCEWPFTADDEIVAKANYVHESQGSGSTNTGNGAFVEAGFRHAWFEPIAAFEWWKAMDSKLDYLAVKGGVNLWARKHQTNVKLEAAWTRNETPVATGGTTTKNDVLGTVQGQIFF